MKKLLAIIAFICVFSSVNAQVVGSWVISKDIEGYQLANTTNGAGSATGIVCTLATQKCEAYLSIGGSGCEVGSTYPAMINSSAGSFPITMKCTSIGTANIQMINETGFVRQAFDTGSEIGFAVPLQDGQFRVVRFNTNGAAVATREVMTPPSVKKTRNKPDQTM